MRRAAREIDAGGGVGVDRPKGLGHRIILLFGSDAAPPVTVVDWQTLAVGTGPADVAYFCGAGLLPAERATAIWAKSAPSLSSRTISWARNRSVSVVYSSSG